MAEYTLTNSAAVVDASIQKVANANTTPTDLSPLMVTSGGVKAYVDAQDTALETQILANTAAIAGSGVKTAKLTAADGSLGGGSSKSATISLAVVSDPDSLVSVTNGVVSLPNAGTYFVGFSGSFGSSQGSGNYSNVSSTFSFYRKTSRIFEETIKASTFQGSFNYVSVETDGTASFYLSVYKGSYVTASWRNTHMHVIKLA